MDGWPSYIMQLAGVTAITISIVLAVDAPLVCALLTGGLLLWFLGKWMRGED